MRDWFGFDPFGESISARDAIRQLLAERPGSPLDLAPATVASVFVPVDVLDAGPEVVVRANLPGIKSDDIAVSYIGNTLTIRGEIKQDVEFKGATYLRHERRASSFSRSINLPVELDVDSADAKFEDGVLTLRLPKSEKIRPKQIKISTSA